MNTATQFVISDWHKSQEGSKVHESLLDRQTQKRRTYGMLEKPSFPPQLLPEEFLYKIFICGRGGVGKTTTAARISGSEVPKTHNETPGLQTWDVYWPAKMRDVEKSVMFHLHLWDAGENSLKKFDHIMPACKEKADAILFLFSFTNKSSFEDIPRQMSRILSVNDNVCKFVMGTKLASHHSSCEVTQRDVGAFEQQWNLPIMTLSNTVCQDYDKEIDSISPVLNYICDQLWIRDQILAGKLSHHDLTSNSRISVC